MKQNQGSAGAVALRRPVRMAGILFGLLVVSALGWRSSSAQNFNLYGSAVNADALDNVRVGPYGQQADYRIEAQHTGYLNDVRVYLIVQTSKPGYEAGNGGTMLVQLETDDGTSNHQPSGNVLASYSFNPQVSFPTIPFSPPPYLTGGQIYHLVFTNTDPDPSVNYVSVDDLYMNTPNAGQMQPAFTDTACAVLIHDTGDSSWWMYPNVTPIVEFDYANGDVQGVGYMEVWAGNPKTIGGSTAQVREMFTVSGSNVNFSQAYVRVTRLYGASALSVTVEDSSGNTVAETTVPASSVPLSSTGDPNAGATYVWVNAQFPSVKTLSSGATYYLYLTSASDTRYATFAIRKGSSNNYFSPGTYFSDGYAQELVEGQWVGWDMWGATNRADGDLQFYFPVIQGCY